MATQDKEWSPTDMSSSPSRLIQTNEPLVCGFRARRVLLRHWERCVNENRDGNAAALAWRNSQSFSMQTPASLVELLRYLFVTEDQGAQVPYTALHKKLLQHMIARLQLLQAKVEKLFETDLPVHPTDRLDDALDALLETSHRFTEMALTILKIADLKFLFPVAEGTFALLKHCAASRARLLHKHGRPHQHFDDSVCPVINLTKGFEVRATGGGAGEIRRRIIKLFQHWAATCKCYSHFHPRLSLALAGLTPASHLAFIQPFVETSKTPAIHQTWLLARPDRLLVRLTMLLLESQAAEPGTIPALEKNFEKLIAAVGSCTSLYRMLVQFMVFLVRLSTVSMPKDGVTAFAYLATLLSDIVVMTVNRPEPIRSIFANEEAVPAIASCRSTIRADVYGAAQALLYALPGDIMADSHSCSRLSTANSLRILLTVACKSQAQLDLKPGAESHTSSIDAIISFLEKVYSLNSISSILFDAKSPLSSGSIKAIEAGRAFLVHRLPHISCIPNLSSTNPVDSNLVRLMSQSALWDTFVLLTSAPFANNLVACLMEVCLSPYMSGSYLKRGRNEEDILLAWLVLVCVGPVLIRQIPCRAMLPCVAIQNVHEALNLADSSMADDTPLLSPRARVVSSAASSASSSAPQPSQRSHSWKYILTFDKILAFILRTDVVELDVGLPPSWVRVLTGIVSEEVCPLNVARELMSGIKEVYAVLDMKGHDFAKRKQNARTHLAKLHNRFKELSMMDETVNENLKVSIRASLMIWRMILVGFYNRLICGLISQGSDESLSSMDHAFLINFLLNEFRSDRFLNHGHDELPLAVLTGIDHLQQYIQTYKPGITEVLFRWTASLCQQTKSFSQHILIKKLQHQANRVLPPEESIKLTKFLSKQNQNNNINVPLLLLEYGCDFTTTEHPPPVLLEFIHKRLASSS